MSVFSFCLHFRSGDESKMREGSDLVTVKKVLDEMEGIRLKAFLENGGIECQLFSFHDSMLDGISQSWREGYWGEIRVFEEDLERAKEILADMERSKPEEKSDRETD